LGGALKAAGTNVRIEDVTFVPGAEKIVPTPDVPAADESISLSGHDFDFRGNAVAYSPAPGGQPDGSKADEPDSVEATMITAWTSRRSSTSGSSPCVKPTSLVAN
jgi:hypothetical protein